MLREGWIFHNDIALEIERKANILYGWPHKPPVNKIYSADRVESGYFAEAMILLLRFEVDYSVDDSIDSFVKKAAPYIGKRSSEIDREEAADLYSSFEELFDKNKPDRIH